MPYNKKPKLTKKQMYIAGQAGDPNKIEKADFDKLNKLSAKMVYPKMAEYGYMKPKVDDDKKYTYKRKSTKDGVSVFVDTETGEEIRTKGKAILYKDKEGKEIYKPKMGGRMCGGKLPNSSR